MPIFCHFGQLYQPPISPSKRSIEIFDSSWYGRSRHGIPAWQIRDLQINENAVTYGKTLMLAPAMLRYNPLLRVYITVISVASFLVTVSIASPLNVTGTPIAVVKNGTLAGKYLPTWDQDAFLGIPYAQPPVGQLRFKYPQSYNASYNGIYDASQYGYSCLQYGTDFNLSEDCLTLNVIRPRIASSDPLPVLVWIYGGGLYTGSTADPQYNLSGIVGNSQNMDQPVIAVSMNYRLGVWGFLQTPQILAEGSSNAGLLDQRLALQWIKENIAAFGGDPNRITIWGESAGAQSIGLHLHSYGGRDDGLYHAAILESGGPIGTFLQTLAYYASPVENLTRSVNCWTASDQLACLRELPSSALFATQTSQTWNPIVDGTFQTAYPSQLMTTNTHVRVPLLIGTNTDEGLSFVSNLAKTNTDTALSQALLPYRSYSLSPPSISTLLALYPPTPPAGTTYPPYHVPANQMPPGYGSEGRRGAAMAGDLVMVAQRRKTCAEFAASGLRVFSYRFDTPAWNATVWQGIPHFVNVAFSFQNISGGLGPLAAPQGGRYRALSEGIGEAYVRFVYGQDPNAGGGGGGNGTGMLPYWPAWSESRVNMVLNANGSFVEEDTFRSEGIDFINTIDRELLG